MEGFAASPAKTNSFEFEPGPAFAMLDKAAREFAGAAGDRLHGQRLELGGNRPSG